MAGSRSKRTAPIQRRRIADDRWEEILDAAARTFAERGFEATTIREVAEAVGMLGGSLYYYIDSKEDLLFAIIDHFHETGLAAMAAIDEATEGDALTKLRALIAARVTLSAQHRAESDVFHNEFRHLSEQRRSDVLKSRRIHEDRVEELIRTAQTDGLVDAEANPRLLALSILAMTNTSLEWYRPDGPVSPAEIGTLQANLLIDGLSSAGAAGRENVSTARSQRPRE